MDISLINSFLDLYALDSIWAEQAVEYGFQNVAEERGWGLSRAEKSHLALGDQAAAEMIRRKALPDAKPIDFRPRKLSVDIGEFDGDGNGEELRQAVARSKNMLRIVADSSNTPYDEVLRNLEISGVSIEQLALEVLASEVTRRAEDLQSPDVHRAMLRRFLNKLNSIGSQIESLDDLPVLVDAVPDHLKQLLSNAHESALLGQEVACAVLCGTALEEALHDRLGRHSFSGAREGIKIAQEKGLFTPQSPQSFAANSVTVARNKATHNPAEFLKTNSRDRRDVLVNARFIIAHMYEGVE